MKKIFVACLALFWSCFATAEAPTCHVHSGGNYCQYTGKVQQVYINSSNIMLMYFDSAIAPATTSAVGITIANGDAAAFNVTDNPVFAKLFYSTLLAAQASSRPVTIQMRGTANGYLKFDRIWLAQP